MVVMLRTWLQVLHKNGGSRVKLLVERFGCRSAVAMVVCEGCKNGCRMVECESGSAAEKMKLSCVWNG